MLNLKKYMSEKDERAFTLKAKMARITVDEWAMRTLQDAAESRDSDDRDVRLNPEDYWDMGYIKFPFSYYERVVFTQEAKRHKMTMEQWIIKVLHKETQAPMKAMMEYVNEGKTNQKPTPEEWMKIHHGEPDGSVKDAHRMAAAYRNMLINHADELHVPNERRAEFEQAIKTAKQLEEAMTKRKVEDSDHE